MTPGGREREPTPDTDHSIHPLELDIPAGPDTGRRAPADNTK